MKKLMLMSFLLCSSILAKEPGKEQEGAIFKLTKVTSLGVHTSPFRDKYAAYLGAKVFLFEQAEMPEIKQLGLGASINTKGEGHMILSPVGVAVKKVNISPELAIGFGNTDTYIGVSFGL